MENHRQHMRVRLKDIRAELRCKAEAMRTMGEVQDVSLGGLYIKNLNDVDVDCRCQVHLTGWDKSDISFVSDVVRVDRHGVALAYVNLDYNSCELIRTLMLYNANEPSEIAILFQEPCS